MVEELVAALALALALAFVVVTFAVVAFEEHTKLPLIASFPCLA